MSEGVILGDGDFGDFLDEDQDTLDFSRPEDTRPIYGPFFPGRYPDRESYEQSLFYDNVWIPRRTAFRKKLDELAEAHTKIYLKQKPDWENILANIESDVQLIFDYLEVA
jgi:hypothetical protein